MKKELVSFVLSTVMAFGFGSAATAAEIVSFPVEVGVGETFQCNFVNLTKRELVVTRTFVHADGTGTPGEIAAPPNLPVITGLVVSNRPDVLYCKLSFKGARKQVKAGILLKDVTNDTVMGASID